MLQNSKLCWNTDNHLFSGWWKT